MPEARDRQVQFAEAYAIGHLAHQAAYGPNHGPRPGIAYKVALEYGAGLLSPDSEDAQTFKRELGIAIDVETNPLTPESHIVARRGTEVILDRLATRSEATAAIPS